MWAAAAARAPGAPARRKAAGSAPSGGAGGGVMAAAPPPGSQPHLRQVTRECALWTVHTDGGWKERGDNLVLDDVIVVVLVVVVAVGLLMAMGFEGFEALKNGSGWGLPWPESPRRAASPLPTVGPPACSAGPCAWARPRRRC